jgi:predicted phage tail protein
MKVVKVYGALREQLGQGQFEFVADTPVQALKALLVNFPGLEKWLLDSEGRGVAYRVTVGKQAVHDEDVSGLFLPWSEQEVFSITPVLMGAGGGVGQILAGVGLVAAAIILGPAAGGFLGLGAGLGGATGAGAAISMGLIGGAAASAIGFVGVSLIIGGVAQLISPTPQPPGLAERNEATRLESNSFSGIVNTTRQGVPVPIAYGRVFVGAAVISAGLDVDQV